MEDVEVARCLGRIEGELAGITREIKDIKDLLKCKEKDCEACKDSIDNKFAITEKRIDGLADIHICEKAVQSWIDTTKGKVVFAITIVSAIFALVLQIRSVLV